MEILKKYLKNMLNKQSLKVKNSLLELKKQFIGLKERQLKDREEKVKGEIRELIYNPIIVLKMIWISLKKKKWRPKRPK